MARAGQKKENDEEALFAALFTLVEKKGWDAVTLPAIARAARHKTADVMQRYSDKHGVLLAFGRYVDAAILEQGDELDGADIKEALFDLFMRRFDVLQTFRGGIVRLMQDLAAGPVTAALLGLELGPALCCTMRRMLDLAGLAGSAPQSVLASFGLSVVYMATLRSWKKDESPDMAVTMACLDRNLVRFIRILRLGA